jgi:hypothetical protein
MVMINGHINGFLRAHAHALPASPTSSLINNRPFSLQPDSVHKTCLLGAGPTPYTSITYSYLNTRHFCDLVAYAGRNNRKHPPEAAARTTVTNGKEFPSRPRSQPYRVKLIAANQMNQAGRLTAYDVLMRLLSGDVTPKPGVDPCDGLTQEETAQVMGILFTGFP